MYIIYLIDFIDDVISRKGNKNKNRMLVTIKLQGNPAISTSQPKIGA